MIFKDFTIALGNYKKYHILGERKWRYIILYTVLLILVSNIGLVVIPTVKMGNMLIDGLTETLPEFTLNSNGLTIESPYAIDFEEFKFLATNEKEVSETDFGDTPIGVLMDSNNIIVKNAGDAVEFSYNELTALLGTDFEFVKNDLSLFKALIPFSVIIASIITLPVFVLSYFLDAFFIAAIGILIGIFMNIRKKSTYFFKIAIYAKTLPCLLAAVFAVFGIHFSNIIATLFSGIIVFLSLKTIQNSEIADDISL